LLDKKQSVFQSFDVANVRKDLFEIQKSQWL